MLAEKTNPEGIEGDLAAALSGADVFIGVSAPGVLKPEMVRNMAEKAIVFAMANPVPEIEPEEAEKAGAFIVGTGRSDKPNQINNVLAFPGIFRGALDCGAKRITEEMKWAAARAIADFLPRSALRRERILPNPFAEGLAEAVATAVKKAARG